MILIASLIYYLRSPRPQAYEWTAGQRQAGSFALTFPSRLVLINLTLAGIILSLLAYYVITANDITAREYTLKSLDERLVTLQELNSRLASEQLLTDNHSSIVSFASAHSMVPAGETVRIVSNGSVALAR